MRSESNHRDSNSLVKQILAAFIAITFFELFLWYWRKTVEPFPEFIYLDFLTNFDNFLFLSKYLGDELVEVLKDVAYTDYPYGFYIFPWIIVSLGLQDQFLADPFKVCIFMTIPMGFITFGLDWKLEKKIFFYLAVFFLPCTQILLKGFNPQAFIVVYSFFALILYFSYLRRPHWAKLLGFLIFALLSTSIKHLGVLYFALAFPIMILWRFLRRESPQLEILLCFSLAILSFPFYPSGSYEYLAWVVEAHSHFFTASSFFLLFALCGLLGVLTLFLMRKKMGSQTIPEFFLGLPALAISFCLWMAPIMYSLDQERSLIAGVTILIIALCSMAALILKFDCRSHNALGLLLFLHMYGYCAFLYLSYVGKSHYIFFLPILLIFFLYLNQSRTRKGPMTVIVLCILFSNFFPPLTKYCRFIKDEEFYGRFYSTLDQNQLGWQKSFHSQKQKVLIDFFESIEFKPEHYEHGVNIKCSELDIRSFFTFPNCRYHFPRLEHSGPIPEPLIAEFIPKFREMYKKYPNYKDWKLPTFEEWARQGVIPIMILDPLLCQKLPTESISNMMTRSLDDIVDFNGPIGLILSFYLFSVDPEIQRYYNVETLILPGSQGPFKAFVHKSLKRRKSKPSGPNFYLRDKAMLDDHN